MNPVIIAFMKLTAWHLHVESNKIQKFWLNINEEICKGEQIEFFNIVNTILTNEPMFMLGRSSDKSSWNITFSSHT